VHYQGDFNLNISTSLNLTSNSRPKRDVSSDVSGDVSSDVSSDDFSCQTSNNSTSSECSSRWQQFDATRPVLRQYTFKLNFWMPLPVPPGSATNNPDYQFVYNSDQLPVFYKPYSEDISITGDCTGNYSLGSALTCSVPANPLPTYTWTGPSGGVTSGPNVTLSLVGHVTYKCYVENSQGNSSRSCNVNVISDAGGKISDSPRSAEQNSAVLIAVTAVLYLFQLEHHS